MTKRNHRKRAAEAAPTLRERAAALGESVARFVRSEAQETDPQRRALMVSGLAAAFTAPLPASAAIIDAEAVHPDAAVFAAQAEVERCREVSRIAGAAFETAHKAFRRDLGAYPAELLVGRFEAARFTTPESGLPAEVRRNRLFAWVTPEQGGGADFDRAWTADGLRLAIAHAVALFGTGGRTPFRIRHWRTLMPLAERFEARRVALEAEHGIQALGRASRDAAAALVAAEVALVSLHARTPEGLAVVVRHLGDDEAWWSQGTAYECLIRSAAAVSGITLPRPDFDPARWSREWAAVGGQVVASSEGWSIVCPKRSDALPATRAEVDRLERQWSRYRRFVDEHLDAKMGLARS